MQGRVAHGRVWSLPPSRNRARQGVGDARQLEIRRIFVTLATLSRSIIYTRALREEGPGAWPGSRAGERRRKVPTPLQHPCNTLQHACNYGDTPALLRCCSAAARGPRPCSSSRKAACPTPSWLRPMWWYRQANARGAVAHALPLPAALASRSDTRINRFAKRGFRTCCCRRLEVCSPDADHELPGGVLASMAAGSSPIAWCANAASRSPGRRLRPLTQVWGPRWCV